MLDPITAIGLAGNILSFIDYSTKVIKTSINIYESASGNTQDSRISGAIATEMTKFAAQLQPPDQTQLSGEEKALCKLAIECEGLAKKILELLQKVKPKNPKSRGSSLVAGFKTKFYEGERKRFEEQLGNCRAQLGVRLNYLTRQAIPLTQSSLKLTPRLSSETQARLDVLVSSAKDDSSRLQHLYEQLEHLRRGLAIENLSPVAEAQLRSLLGMSEHAFKVIIQHRILESLSFEGMYGRYEAVDNAHFKTFRWIFDDDSHDEEDEDVPKDSDNEDVKNEDQARKKNKAEDAAKVSARESFLDWISSRVGIFHISGKLGSGKSTLMKYLCGHRSTKSLLEKWADGRQLVFASYFFWKPGSIMQKSLAGLIRSLLQNVLKARPELIQDILPGYWMQMTSEPWQIQSKLSISDQAIREAFSRLVSDSKLYTNHCFCFFIDGLDEYEGTYQEDSKTLVDLLRTWTKLAPTTVKICVSSREYPVFMNAFSEDQRIRLHNLTRADMTSYVLDKLRHMHGEEYQMSLTRAIVEKAQGMFVWVSLVVKRVREQIENGVSIDTLNREIDTIPKELDDLFKHILNSLVDSDLRVAYQTFSMVLELNQHNHKLSLFSYSFLDDFTQDPMFSTREEFQCRLVTPEARALQIEAARKRLNGRCRGLLETRPGANEQASEIIEITHRSISEFLSSRAQKEQMEQYLDGFNTIDAISHLTLAELWSIDAGGISKSSGLDWLALSLVPLLSKARRDTPPYSFLRSLALAWQRHQDQGNFDCVGDHCLIVKTVNRGTSSYVDLISDIERTEPHRNERYLRHPIYAAAASGNFDYVLWELKHNPSAIPLFTPLRLMYCVLKNIEHTAGRSQQDVLDFLHIHFGICPETSSSLFCTCLSLATDASPEYLGDKDTEIPLWHHVLLICCVEPEGFNSRRGEGHVVERFLEYGADPYFYITVTKSPKFLIKLLTRVKGEYRAQQLTGAFLSGKGDLHECGNASLADLIEQWDFDNKVRILELIQRNTARIESEIEHENMILFKELTTLTFGIKNSATQEDSEELPAEYISDNTNTRIYSDLKRDELNISEYDSQKLLRFNVVMSIGILVLGILLALLIQRLFG